MKTHHCRHTHLKPRSCALSGWLSGNKSGHSLLASVLLLATTSLYGSQRTNVLYHFKFVYAMKNILKWTNMAAGISRGIRCCLYIMLKNNLSNNCHVDASGLLPTGASDVAEWIFRLIASHRRLLCPGRSPSCHWQCCEGSLLETSREWCAYLRSKMIFTWFKIVSTHEIKVICVWTTVM